MRFYTEIVIFSLLVLASTPYLHGENTYNNLPETLKEEQSPANKNEIGSEKVIQELKQLEEMFRIQLRKFKRKHIDSRFIDNHEVDVDALINEEAKKLAAIEHARSKKLRSEMEQIVRTCKATECYELLVNADLDQSPYIEFNAAKARIKSTVVKADTKQQYLSKSEESRRQFIADLKKNFGIQ